MGRIPHRGKALKKAVSVKRLLGLGERTLSRAVRGAKGFVKSTGSRKHQAAPPRNFFVVRKDEDGVDREVGEILDPPGDGALELPRGYEWLEEWRARTRGDGSATLFSSEVGSSISGTQPSIASPKSTRLLASTYSSTPQGHRVFRSPYGRTVVHPTPTSSKKGLHRRHTGAKGRPCIPQPSTPTKTLSAELMNVYGFPLSRIEPPLATTSTPFNSAILPTLHTNLPPHSLTSSPNPRARPATFVSPWSFPSFPSNPRPAPSTPRNLSSFSRLPSAPVLPSHFSPPSPDPSSPAGSDEDTDDGTVIDYGEKCEIVDQQEEEGVDLSAEFEELQRAVDNLAAEMRGDEDKLLFVARLRKETRPLEELFDDGDDPGGWNWDTESVTGKYLELIESEISEEEDDVLDDPQADDDLSIAPLNLSNDGSSTVGHEKELVEVSVRDRFVPLPPPALDLVKPEFSRPLLVEDGESPIDPFIKGVHPIPHLHPFVTRRKPSRTVGRLPSTPFVPPPSPLTPSRSYTILRPSPPLPARHPIQPDFAPFSTPPLRITRRVLGEQASDELNSASSTNYFEATEETSRKETGGRRRNASGGAENTPSHGDS